MSYKLCYYVGSNYEERFFIKGLEEFVTDEINRAISAWKQSDYLLETFSGIAIYCDDIKYVDIRFQKENDWPKDFEFRPYSPPLMIRERSVLEI